MSEQTIEQPIREVDIQLISDGELQYYRVGLLGVTRIEACEKSGPYSMIPYIRVWKGERCEGEFCQHNIVGVYFGDPA